MQEIPNLTVTNSMPDSNEQHSQCKPHMVQSLLTFTLPLCTVQQVLQNTQMVFLCLVPFHTTAVVVLG